MLDDHRVTIGRNGTTELAIPGELGNLVRIEEAPFGVIGLETAFSALHTRLVLPGVLTLETLLERMSAGPARALGLPEPRIEVGARANLVSLDLDAEWVVTEDGFRSRSQNSWLLEQTLRGKVVKTVADGRVVWGQVLHSHTRQLER